MSAIAAIMNIAMATCLSNMPRPPVNPLLELKMMRQVMRRMANRSPSVARAGGDMDLHFARAEDPGIGKSMMVGS